MRIYCTESTSLCLKSLGYLDLVVVWFFLTIVVLSFQWYCLAIWWSHEKVSRETNVANVGLSWYYNGRYQMGWLKSPIWWKSLCSHATQLLPKLSGSGSRHGSRPAHGLNISNDPFSKWHKRAASSTRGFRVGHCAPAPRRTRGQRRRPIPHFVERIVHKCAPSGFSEPNPSEVFGCLFVWAPFQCRDLSTWEISRPNTTSPL